MSFNRCGFFNFLIKKRFFELSNSPFFNERKQRQIKYPRCLSFLIKWLKAKANNLHAVHGWRFIMKTTEKQSIKKSSGLFSAWVETFQLFFLTCRASELNHFNKSICMSVSSPGAPCTEMGVKIRVWIRLSQNSKLVKMWGIFHSLFHSVHPYAGRHNAFSN